MSFVRYGTNIGPEQGPYKCNEGFYLNKISGTYDDYLNSLQGTCSDGMVLPLFGENKGTTFSVEDSAGWAALPIRYDGRIIKFANFGRDTGRPVTYKCANKSLLNGYSGTSNFNINSLTPYCGFDEKICATNLESPECKTIKVSKPTLNAACGLSMTDTCYARYKELNENILFSYCFNKPDDELCACRGDPPRYIDAGLKSQSCWNKKCANSRYIPEDKSSSSNIGSSNIGSCPGIRVCKESVPESELGNLMPSVQLVDCKGTYSLAAISSQSAEASLLRQADKSQSFFGSMFDVIKILLFLLILISIILYFMDVDIFDMFD